MVIGLVPLIDQLMSVGDAFLIDDSLVSWSGVFPDANAPLNAVCHVECKWPLIKRTSICLMPDARLPAGLMPDAGLSFLCH